MNEGISLEELWTLLGEKDVIIYQLTKAVKLIQVENEKLAEEVKKLKEKSDGHS